MDLLGCGDWTKNCEVECVDGKGPIPKVVHFIKTDNGFRFHEWVAVMAARKAIKPKKIFVHSAGEIESCWWNRTRPFVRHHIVRNDMWVNTVNGYKVTELAHKTDFMKNALLYKLGGIYSDTDSIATKSFDDLLHSYQAVVSIQISKMPGNGLLVAQKESCFMCAFAKQACRNFDSHWDTHSVQTLDSLLATRLYENVKVLKYANGFFPFGWNKEDVQSLYEDDMNTLPFSLLQVYAVHLYNSGVFTKIYRPSFYNYTWLIGSPSTAAHAIRAAFPSWFNETYLNVSLCIDPPVLSKSVW